MKKLVLILMLLFTCNLFSQLAPPKQQYQKIDLHLGYQKEYYNQKHIPVGPFVMLGGCAMALAGYLTVPPYEANSTQYKPFFKQGGRMLAIMTGGSLFVVGATVTIAGH